MSIEKGTHGSLEAGRAVATGPAKRTKQGYCRVLIMEDRDAHIRQRLKYAALFTVVIFAIELVGGVLTNSLALISDAAHVLMDVLALTLSWFAHKISSRPPTETRTYGLHRMEVFASFINGATLVFISLFIFYKAYGRLLDPPEVAGFGMLVVAVIGFAANMVVVVWLKDVAAHDLNVKSAFLHVLGDAAASVGVIAAAIIIEMTGWNRIDPLISIAIGAVIAFGSIRIVRESSHILLEGVPADIVTHDVVNDITSIEGVTGLHSLHIWSICHNINALSAHVDLDEVGRKRQAELLESINEKLAETHHIFYTTIQVECSTCKNGELFRTFAHTKTEHKH